MPRMSCDLADFEHKGTSIFRGTVLRKGTSGDTTDLSFIFSFKPGSFDEESISRLSFVNQLSSTFKMNMMALRAEMFLGGMMFFYKYLYSGGKEPVVQD